MTAGVREGAECECPLCGGPLVWGDVCEVELARRSGGEFYFDDLHRVCPECFAAIRALFDGRGDGADS